VAVLALWVQVLIAALSKDLKWEHNCPSRKCLLSRSRKAVIYDNSWRNPEWRLNGEDWPLAAPRVLDQF
jgi:hypothetical protein